MLPNRRPRAYSNQRPKLALSRVRVARSHCGPKLEVLGWLGPDSRVTRRLADSVAQLCSAASVLHVSRHFELDWKMVKNIDKRALPCQLGRWTWMASR